MAARRPKQADDFRLETLDNEVLLYHPLRTETIYLNESAALIWRLCDGQRTTDDITELLKDAFPDTERAIDEDVRSALKELSSKNAITFV